jgi:hypothetical protein
MVKDAWKKIDPKLKEQMDAEYKEEMKKWRIKMDAWKEKHGDEKGGKA